MQTKRDFTTNTERLNQLTEYVCSVYGWSYAELADKLGVNKSYFTRMRNGGFGAWGYTAFCNLIDVAVDIDKTRLIDWLTVQLDEDTTSDGLTQGDVSPDNQQIG